MRLPRFVVALRPGCVVRRACTDSGCASGGALLPWSEFHAATKWPDGTMRRPQSRCKDCAREAGKIRRAELAKTAKGRRERNARQREYRNGLDPDRVSVIRAYSREWYREQNNVPPERWRRKDGGADVATAPIRDAVTAADVTVSEIARRAELNRSTMVKALKRERIATARARAILEAIGLFPLDIGL